MGDKMGVIRRISLFGGPGSGKSSTSAFLFSELKARGFSIEIVTEYIKFWTYISRKPESFDSVYCMAKQLHKEDTILRGQTKLTITDSPLMLQCFYSWYHNEHGSVPMEELEKEVEEIYPSLNIFLTRGDYVYDNNGRYENFEQAKQVDVSLRAFLNSKKVNYLDFTCNDKIKILDYVLEKIG